MFSYIWPIALVVLSNTVYQICAKSVPLDMHPMASLTVTYLMAAVASGILYFAMNQDGNLLREYTHLNWAPVALGIVIVGLEVGLIYAYRVGWQVSIASTTQSAFLAIALLFVGFFLYHEPLSLKKILGALVCLAGLYLMNQ